MSIFKGCATATVTPFIGDEVDFEAFGRLIDYQIQSGISAIVVCGTTGEAPTLSDAEKSAVIEFAVKRSNKRVPIIAGTGCNNTAKTIEASKTAEALGADGLLVVTPYYNKTTQSGLIAHYNAIADSVNIPIIVYNIPGRTGLNIQPETMCKIAEHRNIAAVKEASGNIEQITRLFSLHPDCDIYSGNDDHVIPIMALGGAGVISTISNIVPDKMSLMCSRFFDGDISGAAEIQLELNDLWKAAFIETNPIPIKAMMGLCGMCSADVRLPLVAPSDKAFEVIKAALLEYGLIDD